MFHSLEYCSRKYRTIHHKYIHSTFNETNTHSTAADRLQNGLISINDAPLVIGLIQNLHCTIIIRAFIQCIVLLLFHPFFCLAQLCRVVMMMAQWGSPLACGN